MAGTGVQTGIRRRRPMPVPIPTDLGTSSDPKKIQQQLVDLKTYLTMLHSVTARIDDELSKRMNEMLFSGVAADRPAAATQDRLYVATGAPATLSFDTGTAWLLVGRPPHGQGYFRRSTATACLFEPYDGNVVLINGAFQEVPDAGVSFGTGGLAASTVYNAYVYMSGSTMTGEFSATAHALQAATGIRIKSGDATRTLVGKVRTDGSTQFVDSVTQRFAISWFNRQPKSLGLFLPADRTTASASFVELSSADRLEAVVWGDAAIPAWASGSVEHTVATTSIFTAIGLDGTGTISYGRHGVQPPALGAKMPMACVGVFSPAEGYRFVTLLGATGAATATWTGTDIGSACGLTALVWG